MTPVGNKDRKSGIKPKKDKPKKDKPKKNKHNEDDIFSAECIVAERRVPSKKGRKSGPLISQFYIKWKGYSDSHNTWEPERNLIDPSILAEWRTLHPLPGANTNGLKRSHPSDIEEEAAEAKKQKKEPAKKKKGKKLKKKATESTSSDEGCPTSLEEVDRVIVPVSVSGQADEAIVFTEYLVTEAGWNHVQEDQARIDNVRDPKEP